MNQEIEQVTCEECGRPISSDNEPQEACPCFHCVFRGFVEGFVGLMLEVRAADGRYQVLKEGMQAFERAYWEKAVAELAGQNESEAAESDPKERTPGTIPFSMEFTR